MARGGREPSEKVEELVTDEKHIGTGGHYPAVLGDIFQVRGSGGPTIEIIDVGDDPRMDRALGSFQHIVARQIRGNN